MKRKNLKNSMAICLYLVLAPVLFIGCESKLNEGYVVKKYYEPARTYTTTTMVMSGKVLIPITNTHYDDEDWYLVIQGVVEQDTLTRTICVTENDYNKYKYGDYLALE